jgi:hypothetical protein
MHHGFTARNSLGARADPRELLKMLKALVPGDVGDGDPD